MMFSKDSALTLVFQSEDVEHLYPLLRLSTHVTAEHTPMPGT